MDYITGPAWLVRLLQRWHLGRSRMGRLLRRQRVEVSAYVRAFPPVEIEAQVARCHLCAFQERCDRAMQSIVQGRPPCGFCPNGRYIRQFRQSRNALRRGS